MGLYPFVIERLLSKPTMSAVREYLSIGDGGGPAISAGAASQATGTVIFSNSNSITFGLNAGTLTASFGGGAGGVAISAGANSQSTGTVIFSNSNGIAFGLNAGTLTASHDGLTSQSNQAASASNGSFAFQTIAFSNANNVTFGTSAGSIITASVSPPSGAAVNFSAGTTSSDLDSVVFSDSNGISFGLAGSTITAQHNGLTSQSNQAFSADGGSSAFQTLSFNNANGATFSNVGGAVELSYTVPSVAGLISAINVSASTTSNNLTAITFSNANGITFGLDASTITASHNGLTSQSNQAASASNGSFAFQTIAFSNANNVTFGTSAGSIITASVNAAGGAGTTVSYYAPPWQYSGWNTTISFGQNTLVVVPFQVIAPLSGSRLNLYVSLSGSLSAGNNTGQGQVGLAYAIYTLNTGASSQSISVLTSYSMTILSHTRSSNSRYHATHYIGLSNATSHSTSTVTISATNASTYIITSVNGLRVLPLPLGVTMTPGHYWLGFLNSTAATGTIQNNISIMGTSVSPLPNIGMWGANSSATNASVMRNPIGWAGYTVSTVAFPAQIALTGADLTYAVNQAMPHFDIAGYGTATNWI